MTRLGGCIAALSLKVASSCLGGDSLGTISDADQRLGRFNLVVVGNLRRSRNASAVSDAPRRAPETTCNSLRGASDTAV